MSLASGVLGLPQYVGNISDDELLEKMWNNIKAFEGVISSPSFRYNPALQNKVKQYIKRN